jgi:hypothetical protein
VPFNRRRDPGRLVGWVLALFLPATGCSLLVDTSGLTSGDDSGSANSSADSGPPNTVDASGTDPTPGDEQSSEQGEEMDLAEGDGSVPEGGDEVTPADEAGRVSDDGGEDAGVCECTTPACCGSSCQTTHTDGEGQSFYDCNALGTDTEDEAMEACAVYAASIGGKASDCSGNWLCSGQPSQACYTGSAGTQYCWGYGGPMNVYPNYCPSSAVGTWD